MATESAKLLRSVLSGSVAPLLKAKGFKRSGNNWTRQCGEAFQCVSVQAHSAGWAFTINLDVFYPALYELLGWIPVPTVSGMCGTRIGSLIPSNLDIWWGVGDGSPAHGSEAVELLESYGLPYLERHLDPRQCANDTMAGSYRAAYLIIAGHFDDARGVLAAAQSRLLDDRLTEEELEHRASEVESIEGVLRRAGLRE